MSKCIVNDGKHTFATIRSKPDMYTVGERNEFHVEFWHTCVACGERRAITSWGELIVKKDGRWQIRKPEVES